VGAEVAAPVPAVLLAVILNSIGLPTSIEVSVYEVAVAPPIAVQLPPLEPQRCHW
jgi:hypothetical protein